jgi:hypothetical protein
VAGVADRPVDGGLARRTGLLPRTLHRGSDRQSGSAHPAGHRRLHHRDRS